MILFNARDAVKRHAWQVCLNVGQPPRDGRSNVTQLGHFFAKVHRGKAAKLLIQVHRCCHEAEAGGAAAVDCACVRLVLRVGNVWGHMCGCVSRNLVREGLRGLDGNGDLYSNVVLGKCVI
eukprot:362295-Chlamydomonas_euryale.AAC.1